MTKRIKWAFDECRKIIAVVLLVIGFALVALPFLSAFVVAALAAVVLLAVVAIGGIVGGSVVLVAIACQPGGFVEVTKTIEAAKAEDE